MQYARINGARLVALEPTNFGADFQALFGQTDVGGYEAYLIDRDRGFMNPFSAARRGTESRALWGELYRDVIAQEHFSETAGKLRMIYIEREGTEGEKVHKILAPRYGFPVPNDDCEIANGAVVQFQRGTLIPHETLPDKRSAIVRFEHYGLGPDNVSYFHRLDNYASGKKYVDRFFGPSLGAAGRFDVYAAGLPSHSGDDWVASRPKYGSKPNPEITMELDRK